MKDLPLSPQDNNSSSSTKAKFQQRKNIRCLDLRVLASLRLFSSVICTDIFLMRAY